MMNNFIFLDTNIWFYFYAQNPADKYTIAKQIIDNNFTAIIVSVQIFGELFNSLTRKKSVSKDEAKDIIIEVSNYFHQTEINTLKVLKVIEINSRYNYSYWDSLIIATALSENCSIIYSEDMQHNQIIEAQTTIINPFIN